MFQIQEFKVVESSHLIKMFRVVQITVDAVLSHSWRQVISRSSKKLTQNARQQESG